MAEVTISKLDGSEVTLHLTDSETAADVKVRLASLWGIPEEEQQLINDIGTIADSRQVPPDCHLKLVRVRPTEAYVVGGLGGDQSTLASVERLVLGADRWEAAPPLQCPRRFCAVAALGGCLYVVGGCGVDGRPLATMECFDRATGHWEEAPPMPGGPRYGCAAAALLGKLYVLGGGDDDGDLAVAERFTHATGEWEPLPWLAGGPRRGCAAAVVAGVVYVVGGNGGTPPLRRVIRSMKGHVLRSAECFDRSTNCFEMLPPMSRPRRGCAAVGRGGALYVVGGGDGAGTVLTSVERFTPASGKWETIAPMSFARYGCAAACMSGAICVFGGSSGGRALLSAAECVLGAAERLDDETGRWERLPPLEVPRQSCAAVAL